MNVVRFSDLNNNNNNNDQEDPYPHTNANSDTNSSFYQTIFGNVGSFGNGPQIPPKDFKIWHTFSPYFRFLSFAFLITICQICLYFLTVFYDYDYRLDLAPKMETIITFGGVFGNKIRSGEVWRFLTAIFLHGSYTHLLFNIIAQWGISFTIEKHYGPIKFLLIYLFTGISGNILHAGMSYCTIAVGASTAIFGMFTLIMAEFLVFFHKIRMVGFCLYYCGVFMAILFLFTPILMPHSAMYAHFGGALAGLFAGFLLNIKSNDKVSWYYIGLIASASIWLSTMSLAVFNIWKTNKIEC